MDSSHWPADPHARPQHQAGGWVEAGHDDRYGWATQPPTDAPDRWPAAGRLPEPREQWYGQRDSWYDHPPVAPYSPAPYSPAPEPVAPYSPAPYSPAPGPDRHSLAPGHAPRSSTPRRSATNSPAGPGVARASTEPLPGRPTGSWWPAPLWTAAAFVVPALLYLVWAGTLDSSPPAGCLDLTDAACRSARSRALASLTGALPGLTAALALALLLAAGLRRVVSIWRNSTIAFASAVIGAGTITLITAMLD